MIIKKYIYDDELEAKLKEIDSSVSIEEAREYMKKFSTMVIDGIPLITIEHTKKYGILYILQFKEEWGTPIPSDRLEVLYKCDEDYIIKFYAFLEKEIQNNNNRWTNFTIESICNITGLKSNEESFNLVYKCLEILIKLNYIKLIKDDNTEEFLIKIIE